MRLYLFLQMCRYQKFTYLNKIADCVKFRTKRSGTKQMLGSKTKHVLIYCTKEYSHNWTFRSRTKYATCKVTRITLKPSAVLCFYSSCKGVSGAIVRCDGKAHPAEHLFIIQTTRHQLQ